MANDDLIDLLNTTKSSEPEPGKPNTQRDRSEAFDPELLTSWNPSRRDYPNVLFITFGGFALIFIVVMALKDRSGGMQIAALLIYTLLIPYILSDRFLGFVPWALLNRFRKKFVLVHCLALAIVYEITTLAFSAKPRLPGWFITSGRKPALFYDCLGVILLALALWESSWISGHKGKNSYNAAE